MDQPNVQIIDYEEIRRALAILADPNLWIELRAFPSASSRSMSGGNIDNLCRAVADLADNDFIYYSVNPIQPDQAKATSKTVVVRRWLFIDVDPTRPSSDMSSTEAEKQEASMVAANVVEHLSKMGWPLPLLIDSGNGWHLLYRIDLPNDQHVHAVIKKFTYVIKTLFDTPAAAIDGKVHNASRIAKLPGTWARKGPNTADRPHRICRIIHQPSTIEVVQIELIAAIAAERGEKKPASTNAYTGTSSAYGKRAIESEMLRVMMAMPGGVEGRNNTLNRAAFSLGQLVGGGVLNRDEVEAALRMAADKSGLGRSETEATIRSGVEAGMAEPRGVPEKQTTRSASSDIPPGDSIVIRASEITPKRVEWLWPGRIPLGKLTTFAGVGGLGKTFVLCDIAARVTVGLNWPDDPGQCCEHGQVLFISGEDDPDDTLVPRMIELGADLSKICFLKTEVQDKFQLRDIETLDRAMSQIGSGIRFVAIDPPTAYLGGVDDHKNAELRSLLSPLKSWAAKHQVALVFNTHINKAQGKVDAMMRVMGSVAWVNAVRAAHMFARDPEDPERRLMVGMKMNIAKERKGLAYRIVSTDDLARVEWLGEVDTTADEAVNQEGKSRKVVASEWLVERFFEQLEWPSDELFKAANAAGVSKNAIWEAKSRLNLPKAKQIVHENGNREWVWWVPKNWSHFETISSNDSQSGVSHN